MCAGCWQDHAGRIARLTLWDLRNSVLHSGRGSAFTIEDFIKLPASVACSHSTVLQLLTGTCDSKRAPPGQPNSTDISRAFAADMISQEVGRPLVEFSVAAHQCRHPAPRALKHPEAYWKFPEVSRRPPAKPGSFRMIPQDAPRVSGRFPADLIRDMVRWWLLQFRFGGRAQHLDEMVLTFVSRAYVVVPSAVRCLLDVPLTPGGPRAVPRGGAGAHQIRRWVWGATTIPKQIQ